MCTSDIGYVSQLRFSQVWSATISIYNFVLCRGQETLSFLAVLLSFLDRTFPGENGAMFSIRCRNVAIIVCVLLHFISFNQKPLSLRFEILPCHAKSPSVSSSHWPREVCIRICCCSCSLDRLVQWLVDGRTLLSEVVKNNKGNKKRKKK